MYGGERVRPAWAADYLKLPFLAHGRDRAGVDCYGLVRLIFQEQRGIVLPSYTEGYDTLEETEKIVALCRGEIARRWSPVPLVDAAIFDVIVFRIQGEPMHVGMVMDGSYFLHTMKGIHSVLERWQSIAWRNRIVEVVRYV